MDSPNRNKTAARPTQVEPPALDSDDRFARLMETATLLAHQGGRGLALARNWLTDTSLGRYPLTTLGMAFGLGVFAGWLVKRR
jgi:hypothetical protein